MAPSTLTQRMDELAAARRAFVHAVVVRAQEPTSARPGDSAIVLEDGSLEGFVGGHCAEGSVRVAALGAIRDGESVLLRVLPGDSMEFPESPGARVVRNPCQSGGALEIFLRPVLPPPLVRVLGDTPIAEAMVTLARFLGFVVERVAPASARRVADGPAEPFAPGSGTGPAAGPVAVIVSSLGRAEEEAIRCALDAGVGFIGLVASKRRGAEVLDGMGLSDAERARVRTHVGIDIGARTPQEIALSALAEVVRAVRTGGLVPQPAAPQPAAPPEPEPAAREVVDPICGMTVSVGPQTPHLRVDGEDHWFCCPGCRNRYARQHAGAGQGE